MKKNLVIVVSIALAVVLGISLLTMRQWQANAAQIEAETLRELTAEDFTDILESEASAARSTVALMKDDSERRKAFIKGMKEHMALAAQARLEGMAEDEKYKINVAYKKDMMLADLYQAKLSEGQSRRYVVPKEQIESVWKSEENVKEFEKVANTLREIRMEDKKSKGDTTPMVPLAGDTLRKSKNRWARTHLLAERAKNDSQFFNTNAIQKRLRVVEAGILSSDYLRKHYATKIRPSEEDIKMFLDDHPEYRPERKLKIAQDLQKQVNEGADLSELAKKHSEDRGSSKGGGVYEDARPEALWREVVTAALKLKPGEITKQLVKSPLGYHIVQLVSTKGEPNSKDFRLTIRHLVIQYKFVEPGEEVNGIPRPFLSPREIAMAAVLQKKRTAFVDSIVAKNPVIVPEDFKIVLPEVKKVEKTEESSGKEKKDRKN